MCTKLISLPSKTKVLIPALIASKTLLTCVETTDKTSIDIRLNSSKHPQKPVWDKPEKIRAVVSMSICSEQLLTITPNPKLRPKSLTVSVLPVPAGPAGAPPKIRFKDWVKVI